jgi:two-component system, LytTR family, response regulator
MSGFRVLVVDDEPLAREVVVDLLRRDNEVAGVTEVADPLAVPAIIASERPDILFLDVEMPGLTGIQIAGSANDCDARAIVFVTAYSQYALDAFGVDATDYLLKPFSDRRFFQALDRAKRRVREHRAAAADALDAAGRAPDDAADPARQPFLHRLQSGHSGHGQWIDLADVLWIEAEDYYVLVHTRRDRHLLRMSMASLEERLDPRTFVRVHRAAIVNMREVTRVAADATALELSDGTAVAVSRSRRRMVERVLGRLLRAE